MTKIAVLSVSDEKAIFRLKKGHSELVDAAELQYFSHGVIMSS